MIFRKILSFALLICLSGCSEFMKGKPEKETVIEIKQDSMSCLQDVSLEISKFLKSESTDQSIDATFKCIDETLSQFQTRVEGREEASAFNSQELFEIFEKFVKNAAISKAATADLLGLKAALLGGSDQRISKTEIMQLRDFLTAIRNEAKVLLPFAKVFRFEADKYSKDFIKAAFSQLNSSLKNLLRVSKIGSEPYSYDSFKNLLLNLKAVGADQAGTLELADRVNDLLVGSASLATSKERELYIDNLTEVLRLYTLEKQGFVKFEITTVEVLDGTLEYVSDVVNLLQNSVQYRKNSLISQNSLDPLVTEIQKKEILPLKISNETALDFYKTLLTRVFGGGLAEDSRAFKGLEPVHFYNIKRELALYRMFNRASGKIATFKFSEQQDLLSVFNKQGQTLLLRICEEMRTEFLQKHPVLYRNRKVVLAANQEIWEQSWRDSARAFHVMMMARQLLLGWGVKAQPHTKEMKHSFLDERGMVQWYSEFKPFGLETGAFDPRVANAGLSNLQAANLFTRSGNGDKRMDFRETIEQLSILMTGGQTYSEMQKGFATAKCDLNEDDVFGMPWTIEVCVKAELRRNYARYYSNMSYLVRYISRLNEAQYSEFFDAMMEVARTDSANRGRLESSDIKMMNLLFHYIESLFATYDKDRNMRLTPAEIKDAYPKFKSYAEAYAHKNSQASLDTFNNWLGVKTGYGCYNESDLIKDGFVYLVLTGKNAGMTNLNLAPCLMGQRPLMDLKGDVDRRGIINTFKILKAVLGS